MNEIIGDPISRSLELERERERECLSVGLSSLLEHSVIMASDIM